MGVSRVVARTLHRQSAAPVEFMAVRGTIVNTCDLSQKLIPALLVLLILGLFPARSVAAHCEYIPAGKTFWVRLSDPVASYSSKPGTAIRAVLIQSPECDAEPVFTAGLQVEGRITKVRSVGLGFKHDTASLELIFDKLVTANGDALPIASQVVEIDNAREGVHHGVVRGIRATNTPQGRITSRLIHLPTYNPYSDMGLIVYRAFFTILPEPEIYLPPGTDLRLQLNVPLYVADQPDLPRASFQMDEYERGDVELLMANSADRTTTSSGKDADLVNILFVGSREQVERAFTAAGWMQGDHYSGHAFFRQFAAFLTFSNYSTMPISRQWLNGQLQDMTWQKSFNSYARREHLRLWSENKTVQGEQAWLSSYTREHSAALSVKNHKFIHHIDRNLDEGVNMLVRDLTLAGCVESVKEMPRPEVPRLMTNSTGDEMHTDGVLSVVHLKNCEMPTTLFTRENPLIPVRPRSRAARYVRSQVLVYKSDVIRGNLLYGAFDLARMGFHAVWRRGKATEDEDNLPLSPVSPDSLFPQITIGD
jgi:hypothetical protein